MTGCWGRPHSELSSLATVGLPLPPMPGWLHILPPSASVQPHRQHCAFPYTVLSPPLARPGRPPTTCQRCFLVAYPIILRDGAWREAAGPDLCQFQNKRGAVWRPPRVSWGLFTAHVRELQNVENRNPREGTVPVHKNNFEISAGSFLKVKNTYFCVLEKRSWQRTRRERSSTCWLTRPQPLGPGQAEARSSPGSPPWGQGTQHCFPAINREQEGKWSSLDTNQRHRDSGITSKDLSLCIILPTRNKPFLHQNKYIVFILP